MSVLANLLRKSHKSLCCALLLTLLFALAPSAAFAQARTTGSVGGNITDKQGSIVPGATAVLLDPASGKSLTVQTNDKGEYQFSDVPVGTYTLTVTAPSFEKYVLNTVNVDAEANVRLDAALQAGSASETVTVTAASTTVDTQSGTVGMVIDNALIEDLPIEGENVVSLAALLPGVTDVNAPTTFTSDTGGPSFNVSGSRSNQNLFLLDGFYWNASFYNTGLNFPQRLALQEVTVLLNNFKAQYGRDTGSVFSAITKTGTNTLHGDVWEYLQNSAFDASDYLFRRNPHLVSNQFGAVVSGPILRDKLFFLTEFQGLRFAGTDVASAETPTYAERGLLSPGVPRPCISTDPGWLGQTCASLAGSFPAGSNVNQIVQNPLYSQTYGASATSQLNSTYQAAGGTGTSPCVQLLTSYMNAPDAYTTKRYLPNAEIPSVCFNPVAQNLYNLLPVPNQPDGITAVSSAKQPRNNEEGLVRMDYNFGHHAIDARFYMLNGYDLTANHVTQGQGVATYEIDNNSNNLYFGGIGDTWILTSNLVNVLRAGYKRFAYYIAPTDPTNAQTLGSQLSVPGVPVLPRFEATNQFTVGSTNSGNSYTLNSNFEINDGLSWQHGAHNFQFGGQFLALDYIHRFDYVPFLESEQQNTEASLGDFLLGLTYTETVGNLSNIGSTQHAAYFYAQDDWRATKKLTLNYGVRYEIPGQWYQPDNQSLTFIPGFQSKVFPNAPPSSAYVGDPGINRSIVPTHYNNVAPRFGFAYDVFGNGKTAIRGGFGMFYDTINANIVGIGEPYHYQATYSQPDGGFSNPLLHQVPVPANYVPGNPQFALPYSINFADPNLVTPYTEATNFGIQQSINSVATIEVNYVGKFGKHQIIPFDLNPAIYDCTGSYYQANPTTYCLDASTSSASYQARVKYPGYNYGGQGIVDNASVGTSNYNALQMIYRQRGKTLTSIASFTWARSLDLQSNGASNTAAVPMTPNLRSNYGPSDFNADLIVSYGWRLAIPGIRNGNRFVKLATNGWLFNGIFNARTGNPLNLYLAGDISLTDERPQRPQLVGNPLLPSNRHRMDKVNAWFPNSSLQTCNLNTAPPAAGQPPNGSYTPDCVFETPLNGTFGDMRRNALVGPAYINTNMSLGRTFPILEGKTIEMRADAFNVWNTPNLNNPNTQLAASASAQGNFGKITSTVGTNGVVGTNGRRLQLSGLFRF